MKIPNKQKTFKIKKLIFIKKLLRISNNRYSKILKDFKIYFKNI